MPKAVAEARGGRRGNRRRCTIQPARLGQNEGDDAADESPSPSSSSNPSSSASLVPPHSRRRFTGGVAGGQAESMHAARRARAAAWQSPQAGSLHAKARAGRSTPLPCRAASMAATAAASVWAASGSSEAAGVAGTNADGCATEVAGRGLPVRSTTSGATGATPAGTTAAAETPAEAWGDWLLSPMAQPGAPPLPAGPVRCIM